MQRVALELVHSQQALHLGVLLERWVMQLQGAGLASAVLQGSLVCQVRDCQKPAHKPDLEWL
jgi:hypothetical protein